MLNFVSLRVFKKLENCRFEANLNPSFLNLEHTRTNNEDEYWNWIIVDQKIIKPKFSANFEKKKNSFNFWTKII